MQRLLSDIKNDTYKPVYLLYGDEAYLRVQYKNKLKEALVAPDDSMNYSYFQGKNVNPAEVIDLSETMPFLADRRVIILENTGFVKDGNETLADYISEGIADTSVIIFVESSVDKRCRLYKAIDKTGLAVSFDAQNDDTLKKWILSRLKKEEKQITAHTLDVLIETVGTDMYTISAELEKLISYTMGRSAITEQDISDVCTVRLQNKVFDLIGKIALKQGAEAIRMYRQFLEMKESPFGVLALIVRQFNCILQIGDLMNRGFNTAQIAPKVGMSPYITGKYIPQAKKFSYGEIVDILEACARTDHAIKRGDVDAEVGVELLITEISM